MKVTRYLARQCKLIQYTSRSIYVRDKDLDKTKYKPSQGELLDSYIKNYMQDDPKNEEEKQKLVQQYKEEIQEPEAKQESQEVEADKGGILNPGKLKDIFDRMTQIDSDPKSKHAQEYFKKIEEMERTNPNKKSSQIIIKTMKKGRTVSREQYSGRIGEQLTEEEKVFQRKYIDYKAVQFPETNPVTMTAKSKGKEVKLANYRWPSAQKDRRGIIYYVHGYGDYCQRYAFLAKQFAEAGYDFVGMDQKGFGYSGGQRAIIESGEIMLEEHLKYFDLVDEKFGGKNVPKFTLGVSMGGMLSLKCSLARPDWFKGMGLVVPYISLLNEEKLNKYLPLAKGISKFWPTMKLAPFPADKKRILNNKFIQELKKDPILEVNSIPVQNILVNQEVVRKFQSEQDKVNTPFIMILGGKDQVVSNRAAKSFFEVCPIKDKDVITYDDGEHFMVMDGEYMPLIVKDLIGWYNTHC